MAREKFENRRLIGTIKVACKFDDNGKIYVRYWEADKQETVQRIRYIVQEFSKQGYILTLRQLHYQLVTRNWIVNHDSAYKKLGNILDDCRYSGVVDWDAIEDRGRVPFIPYWVNDVEHALKDTLRQYRVDRQLEQPNHVELWTEKDALSGILRRTTSKYHIQLVVNKGYTSSSDIYNAYERVVEAILNDQKVTILYFGDHDPSGLDMIRDIRERLNFFLSRGNKLMFAEGEIDIYDEIEKWWDESEYDVFTLTQGGYCNDMVIKAMNDENYAEEGQKELDAGKLAMFLEEKEFFTVKAIGLTMDQIKEFNLPENPTKLTDSRSDKYIQKYGKRCWEVDALDPSQLTAIVEKNITDIIDMGLYEDNLLREAEDKQELEKIINSLNN